MKKTLRAQIYALELSHLNPNIRQDSNRIKSLLHTSFQEIGASGTLSNYKTALDSLKHEQRVERILENFDIHQLSPSVLLTTYTVMKTDPHTKLEQHSRRSSIWCRMSDVWQLRFHQGTPLSDSGHHSCKKTEPPTRATL